MEATMAKGSMPCNSPTKRQTRIKERKELSLSPAIRPNSRRMPAITISMVIIWSNLVKNRDFNNEQGKLQILKVLSTSKVNNSIVLGQKMSLFLVTLHFPKMA